MISAKFRVQLPEGIWVADTSRAFPDATFRLLSGLRIGEKAVELGEVIADDPQAIIDRPQSSIDGWELLEATDERALTKYETTDIELYEFVESSALTVEFPVVVRDGWYEFDLTGTRDDLERFGDALDEAGQPYELQSIVGTTDPESLLTDRQRELLDAALQAGYFEVPRDCTLAELAETLGVDKSTASTVLRTGEAKLVAWFLTGPKQN
ncbi:helix-turn-helix domain-containing protein [Natronorubrum sp. DTA7]|uniref:helix-turn-helix domain-containing protein n=1 Tax=Natronorubrum sp. DTA7 TaxID=3447016 RepID=UPI003F8594F4